MNGRGESRNMEAYQVSTLPIRRGQPGRLTTGKHEDKPLKHYIKQTPFASDPPNRSKPGFRLENLRNNGH
jgi:hypothetical protein